MKIRKMKKEKKKKRNWERINGKEEGKRERIHNKQINFEALIKLALLTGSREFAKLDSNVVVNKI